MGDLNPNDPDSRFILDRMLDRGGYFVRYGPSYLVGLIHYGSP